MNGAEALLRTLVAGGVDTCFANPGTSEMHFVATLDSVPEMRAVLALFEGVASGAADGYGRMAGRPAATLLHLGPGLGNALANLHNARRAATPVVNVVGDHATSHQACDAPLQSDIETVARNVSRFVRVCAKAGEVGTDAADAISAACGPPGGVATLVLPADVSWGDGGIAAAPHPAAAPTPVGSDAVDGAARALRSGVPAAILIGGPGCRTGALKAAARVSAASGARLLCETFPARLERGAGLPPVERLAYFGEFVSMQLEGLRHLVLAGARPPVSFFAYPGKPGYLVPDGCAVHALAGAGDDVEAALAALADALGAPPVGAAQPAGRPALPTGALTAPAVCDALGALLPEGAIVSDEGNTAGLFSTAATAGAPPNDWLCLTGGAIGQGLPLAVGAAVACPDRPVVAFEADGSALYTLQAWWTMAREELDVTTILLNNRSYAILSMELARVGAGSAGPRAASMLDLSRPDMDFTSIAAGLGVPARRVSTADELVAALRVAFAEPGPHVVEAVIPPL